MLWASDGGGTPCSGACPCPCRPLPAGCPPSPLSTSIPSPSFLVYYIHRHHCTPANVSVQPSPSEPACVVHSACPARDRPLAHTPPPAGEEAHRLGAAARAPVPGDEGLTVTSRPASTGTDGRVRTRCPRNGASRTARLPAPDSRRRRHPWPAKRGHLSGVPPRVVHSADSDPRLGVQRASLLVCTRTRV